jgi:hypothetical protein
MWDQEIDMSATLKLTRSSRLADAARTYQVVLDGKMTREIRNSANAEMPIAPGKHMLQILVPKIIKISDQHPSLSSPAVTFDVDDGETVEFVSHPPSYPQAALSWIVDLSGKRDRWIELRAQ